jgi:hypothetical protein
VGIFFYQIWINDSTLFQAILLKRETFLLNYLDYYPRHPYLYVD